MYFYDKSSRDWSKKRDLSMAVKNSLKNCIDLLRSEPPKLTLNDDLNGSESLIAFTVTVAVNL